MANKVHQMRYMILVEPEKAKREIIRALRKTGMHRAQAAAELGCAHSTFLKWIEQLKMADEIEALEETSIRNGWHHGSVGGRPKGKVWSQEERRARGFVPKRRSANA